MRLVIIDTFVKFKPVSTGKIINQYENDYQHVSKIKDLADDNEVSLLLIHHLRKTDATDVFDTFSGTFGITAAADGLLALVKSKDSTVLHVTGRDLENEEYALKFESHKLSWEIIGKAEDVQSSKSPCSVVDRFEVAGSPGLVEERLGRAVQPEQHEPALARHRAQPVRFGRTGRKLGAEVQVDRTVVVVREVVE